MQFVINKSLFEVNQAPLFEATLSAPPSVFSPVQLLSSIKHDDLPSKLMAMKKN